MLALTYFTSKKDNRPDGKVLRFADWHSFCGYLTDLSKHAGRKPKLGEEITPDCSPLISPAMFHAGTKRRKDSVVGWAGWAALDIDNYEGNIEDFDSRGFECLLYSTSSSREGKPAFRVVVPLTKWIKNAKVPDFWYALNMHYLEIGDPQAKDTCRIYYVPAKYPDAYNFVRHISGDYVDPDTLMAEYPMPRLFKQRMFDRVPTEMQKAIHAERHQSLLERGINLEWTTYKDCPFVNKRLVNDYLTDKSQAHYHRFFSLMVSIASRANLMGYEISPGEIEDIMREIDENDGTFYSERPIRIEAERAIQFAQRR